MTYTNSTHQKPMSLSIRKPLKNVKLIIHGQGVLIFNSSEACSLLFCDVSGTPGLKIQFTENSVLANLEPSGSPLVDSKNTHGLVKQNGAYYWVSLDAQNQRLYAGIGEARKETAIYVYQWPQDSMRESTKQFLENLVSVNVENLQATRVLRDPITRYLPLYVKNTEGLTMDMLASSTHIPKANLSITSQKLYECIAGNQFKLNTPDFPEFTDAIEHSINTPGKWCYERLKQKSTEFDKDKPDEKETYLRITLGENNGESPGIPYVMEIWPSEHYSPIHNHAGASAIIRVLHGSIQVSLFPFLSGDAVEPFAAVDFVKDDITWISPQLNQIHQLKNTKVGACITIQCYMYEEENKRHYDYFDYLDADGSTHQFEPDSDMDFTAFKALIKKEWLEARVQPNSSWLSCCFRYTPTTG
jgi:hypothetical protein